MSVATLQISFSVEDGAGNRDGDATRARWSCGDASSLGVQRQKVTLAGSVFTTITVPAGAKSVEIRVGSAVSLTLKGVTGDTGVKIAPATNPTGVPVIMPLDPTVTPSLGILNGSAASQTVEVIFTL